MKVREFIRPKISVAGGTSGNERPQRVAARKMFSAVLFVILALIVACDSNTAKPPEAKPEPKGPELLTGRGAFQKVFIAARNYAVDAKPFRIESTPTTDANGQDGKSAIW